MNKTEFEDYLIKGLDAVNLNLLNPILNFDSFYKYCELLEEYNKKINLTSIQGAEKIIEKHFIESLLLVPYICELQQTTNCSKKIIDIGTGAGFPGIPIKIALQSSSITLVESINKKVKFLEVIKSELGLNLLEITSTRGESLGHELNYRENYDIAISRAVGKLPFLIEMSIPFLKIGGLGIFPKGADIQEELNQSKKALLNLQCEIKNIIPYSLPFSKQTGNIVIIKKLQKTSFNYPRNMNKLGVF